MENDPKQMSKKVSMLIILFNFAIYEQEMTHEQLNNHFEGRFSRAEE